MTTTESEIATLERPFIDEATLDRSMAQVGDEGLELLGPDGVLTDLTSRIMNRRLLHVWVTVGFGVRPLWRCWWSRRFRRTVGSVVIDPCSSPVLGTYISRGGGTIFISGPSCFVEAIAIGTTDIDDANPNFRNP